MKDAAAPVLGIDLGTTNSAVAVYERGEVRVIPNSLGEPLTPSVVALDQRSGALVVGRTAKEIYLGHPELGAALFKRGMGTDLTYTMAGATYGAVELSALVLRSLRRDAEEALAEEVTTAVITVPAYFDESQRCATMKAGELAGLDVARILNEPTAAAIAHGAHRSRSDAMLLVIDLGGGTFDVCVMERFEGALEVRGVAGESMLGGEDFTRRLASLALGRVGVAFEHAEIVDRHATTLLLKRAELLKRRLSREDEGVLEVPPVRSRTERPTAVRIRREESEAAFAPLVDRLRGPCASALRGAGVNRNDIDEVILVGGATRMPMVRRFVRDLLPHEPLTGVDPDLAVVHGAAVQGALCRNHEAVADLVVTDVASHSLGVGVAKKFGGQHVQGFFSPIIHRNTVIPTSQKSVFHTLRPNQTEILFGVYEGESRHVKDNRRIGELKVRGIPPGPPGAAVEVRFTYDLNGMLEMEAKVIATGEVVSRVFSRSSESLSEDQLRAARARLDRIREDPREAPRIRDLLARAETLLQDVGPEDRDRVEGALDALEEALAVRDPRRIAKMAKHLERLCDELDSGERW